jgi:hypothetical protein
MSVILAQRKYQESTSQLVVLTSSTGISVALSIFSATLPQMIFEIPERPCVAMMIRSAPLFTA